MHAPPVAMRSRAPAVALAAALFFVSPAAPAADGRSSAEELVRQAEAHEATHEDDLAVRRYMEALALDPTSGDAWLGLGAIRLRHGDAAEAERVYSAALQHTSALPLALRGRAYARWALGHRAEAEADLDTYATLQGDAAALRELGQWYGIEGRTPAQLATWRRLLAMAPLVDDAALAREAKRMVRALVILVDGADPAASPIDPDEARKALAAIAKRGG
jgi:tetratricopeptide (TPR) repeat protein